MSLDERLREIFINDSKRKGLHDDSYTNYVVTPDEIIPQIKAAFEAEGYIEPKAKMFWSQQGKSVYITSGIDRITRVDMEQLMSGADWYAKFEKIVNEDTEHFRVNPNLRPEDLPIAITNKVLEAAKKEAGLE